MATILLSAAGAAAGSVFGPVGAMVGRALGASVGYMIDGALMRSTQPDQKGPRLGDVDIQTSTEGRAIPRLYGRARLTGQMIWATRYEEETVTQSQRGGKGGGPTTTNYRYFANVAIALCEGSISHIGRIWADGQLLDTTNLTLRIHTGREDQSADSLILARQPNGAPAYRGTAYVVFERLPLDPHGNRIPQFSFEVIRAVDTLEPRIRAVTMIPGATEFGYGTTEVKRQDGPGATVSENRHVTHAATDFAASLDELAALCPNLTWVALVVTWFGTDLRAGQCQIRPGVESLTKATSAAWSVNGVARGAAYEVSRINGQPAFGGTPSDASVIEAIRAIRARGLKVMLYPFLLMDVPAGNALPSPYGGAAQPAYPWRGRITCHPAAGQPGTVDGTAAAASQIAALVGSALPAHLAVAGQGTSYSGPAEWSFRRFILHHARLAEAAGGVDGFLLASELRGLTTTRGPARSYPFVAALQQLAADVKAMLGPAVKLSYGADWSEWFGHQPADGSGDVAFHLDPFWASANVDFVGIDSYLPLTDCRHGPHLDRAGADDPRDLTVLMAGFSSGEGYDWYYASGADRRAQIRTPITDGAYGKPWIYRPKDFNGWWSHRHFDRISGVESPIPTAWLSQMKPIWFTETGCPAVDLAANQPNVFPDAHSSEGALPHFSRGARDDLSLRRFAEATVTAWTPGDPDAPAGQNPTSAVYGGPMVDPQGVFLWTWDARPFPAFPGLSDVWSDGANWATGHWLNGRLGGVSVAGLIRAVLADHGVTGAEFGAIAGHVDGFIIDDRMSARAALEPILAAFLVDAHDTGTGLRFAGRSRRPAANLTTDDLVDEAGKPLATLTRGQDTELPAGIAVTVSDALRDYRRTTVSSRRRAGLSRRETTADLPVVAPVDVMSGHAETWLQDVWAGREHLRFAVSPARLALEPGDIVDVPVSGRLRRVIIDRIEDGASRRIEGRSVDPDLYAPVRVAGRAAQAVPPVTFGPPVVAVIDISRPVETGQQQPLIAASASPWPGTVAVLRSTGSSWESLASLSRRATMGVTLDPLGPGPTGLWHRGGRLRVKLQAGSLASASEADVLAGANVCALQNAAGGWEVLQFQTATLIAADTWEIAGLLRGQRGSETEMGAPAGATFVLLDAASEPLPVGVSDLGTAVGLKVGPARYDYTHPAFVQLAVTPSGRGLMPFSPAHPAARRDAATGDLLIRWIRRSRAAGADNWMLPDAPLDEPTERYRIDILAGAVLKRTASVTQPAYTYTAADQTADFGGPATGVTLRIAQIGATLGPGLPATLTL